MLVYEKNLTIRPSIMSLFEKKKIVGLIAKCTLISKLQIPIIARPGNQAVCNLYEDIRMEKKKTKSVTAAIDMTAGIKRRSNSST